MIEYVTITSDISMVKGKVKVATWAFYIRTPKETIKMCGEFKEFNHITWWLEARALANALHVTSQHIDLSNVRLIIYSEILSIINPNGTTGPMSRLSTKTKTGRAKRQFLADHIQFYLDKASSYELRKVDAHSTEINRPGAETKYFMNDWCDKHSKKLRKKLVQERTM